MILKRLFAYRNIKSMIKQLDISLSNVIARDNLKISLQKRANLHARKNELIFAIKKLNELL